MQWAIFAAIDKQGVLPAPSELARLTLAICHILTEIDDLLGGHIEADCLLQVIKRYLTITIVI